uniref:Uncharacterized protein n=1 Tax=Solanum tuberosum TaxID=4113 RepID=M1DBA3_SOLTU
MWPAKTVQFPHVQRCESSLPSHSAKRKMSNLFAEVSRTFGLCRDPNGGLCRDRLHGWAAEDCSATLVEFADELSDPPFGQLIGFNFLPLASSHSRSLGGTILHHEIDRRLANCSFARFLIHFLQGFAYWNEGWFMLFRKLAKLN